MYARRDVEDCLNSLRMPAAGGDRFVAISAIREQGAVDSDRTGRDTPHRMAPNTAFPASTAEGSTICTPNGEAAPPRANDYLSKLLRIIKAALTAGLAEGRQRRDDELPLEVGVPHLTDSKLVAASIVDAAQRLLLAATHAQEARRELDAGLSRWLRDDAARLVYVAMNVVERPNDASDAAHHQRERQLIRDSSQVEALLGVGVVARARGTFGDEILLADGSLLAEVEDPAGGRCWALEAWREPRRLQ